MSWHLGWVPGLSPLNTVVFTASQGTLKRGTQWGASVSRWVGGVDPAWFWLWDNSLCRDEVVWSWRGVGEMRQGVGVSPGWAAFRGGSLIAAGGAPGPVNNESYIIPLSFFAPSPVFGAGVSVWW